jgi:hypothetical protein
VQVWVVSGLVRGLEVKFWVLARDREHARELGRELARKREFRGTKWKVLRSGGLVDHPRASVR